MPLDDEIIEEIPLEVEENTPDNPTDNPVDIDDPEVNDESLVQDEIDLDSIPEGDNLESMEDPEIGEAEIELSDSVSSNDGPDSVSSNDLMQQLFSIERSLEMQASENIEEVDVYTDLEAFETSTIQVDLYQYTILNRLEFIQYALCIVIALLFLQIFVRYKK